MCIDIVEIWFGIVNGQISSKFDGLLMGKFRQCLTELSARDTIMAGYYSLRFLFQS